MKIIETDPRLPEWLNRVLNTWPFCVDASQQKSLFAFAWDNQGPYLPPDDSLFMNGYVMFRLQGWWPGLWFHVKPRINTRIQFGIGWKGNGRIGATFRIQTDEQAAAGVLGHNAGQAKGWSRGTA